MSQGAVSWRDAAQLRPLTAQEGGDEAARWMEVADGTKYYFKPAMTLDDEVSWVRLSASPMLCCPGSAPCCLLVSALFRLRFRLRLRLSKADKKRCLDLQVQPKQQRHV